MGGHGALQIALNHPEEFGIAGAHSPALRPRDELPDFFGDEAWFERFDPASLLSQSTGAARILTWIDVGNDDQWRAPAEQLRDAFLADQAPVDFHVLEGEHQGWYWRAYLPEYLRFYSEALYSPLRTPGGAPYVATDDTAAAALASAGILAPAV